MAKAAPLVDGLKEVDVDKIPDGVGVSVSDSGPVQGNYREGLKVRNAYEFQLLKQDGSVHATLAIKQF